MLVGGADREARVVDLSRSCPRHGDCAETRTVSVLSLDLEPRRRRPPSPCSRARGRNNACAKWQVRARRRRSRPRISPRPRSIAERLSCVSAAWTDARLDARSSRDGVWMAIDGREGSAHASCWAGFAFVGTGPDWTRDTRPPGDTREIRFHNTIQCGGGPQQSQTHSRPCRRRESEDARLDRLDRPTGHAFPMTSHRPPHAPLQSPSACDRARDSPRRGRHGSWTFARSTMTLSRRPRRPPPRSTRRCPTRSRERPRTRHM